LQIDHGQLAALRLDVTAEVGHALHATPAPSLPAAIAAALRRRSIDVTTAADAGLLGAKDEDHLAFAITQGRVLYTNDEDFLVLHALHARRTSLSGIVYCHQQTRSVGDVIRALVLLWEVLDPDDMRNHVEFI
jgi:predicted nuclease of predicted toxin-antitoxin system